MLGMGFTRLTSSFHSPPADAVCSGTVLYHGSSSALGSHVSGAAALLGLSIPHQTCRGDPRWEDGGRVPYKCLALMFTPEIPDE